nr:MAG TPA: hypothetical protein [Caudoviricetes sp.]
MSSKCRLLTGIGDVGIPRLRMPPTSCAMGVVPVPYISHLDTFIRRFLARCDCRAILLFPTCTVV